MFDFSSYQYTVSQLWSHETTAADINDLNGQMVRLKMGGTRVLLVDFTGKFLMSFYICGAYLKSL